MHVEENTHDRAQAAHNEQGPPIGGIITEYIAEETDTLPEIAERYGVSIEEILEANKETLKTPADLVTPGLKIMIPFKRSGT